MIKSKLWLRAASEQELIEALPFVRYKGEWITSMPGFDLVVMGVLSTDAIYDEAGEVVTPPVPIEGYHANMLATDEIRALIPFNIQIAKPNNPKCDWAE